MDSLELLLDDDAASWVRADWDRLIVSGLPSAGQHRSSANQPHITLLAAPSLTADTVPDVDDRAAAAVGVVDLPLTSAGMLLFGPHRGGYVLARHVVTTPELLELHRRVHDAVAPVPAQVRTSLPGVWTPHITLARRLKPAQLAAAVQVLEHQSEMPPTLPPAPLRAVGLRRWDAQARTVVRLA